MDTGATVSTVNRSFYDEFLKHIPMQPLDSILNIECADGQMLPYDGVVQLNLEFLKMDDLCDEPVTGLF